MPLATPTRSDPTFTTRTADQLFRKISWRIMPLLLLCYAVAYLDRINIGYAQLQMKQTLDFSDAVYGLGAGIFFIGYLLFEVPSNLMLEKSGARKTLLRIMVCWGLVAGAMGFVTTPFQFYAARFLLGAFEAGFFPGVILYLTYWYPAERRARMIAVFMCATTLAALAAGPLSGAILKHCNGLAGLAGWQWLFMIEGLPASLLGVVAYLALKDGPAQAAWLSGSEKRGLQQILAESGSTVGRAAHGSLGQMLADPRVYLLALAYAGLLAGTMGLSFMAPSLIRSWGVDDLVEIGWYTGLPNLLGLCGMLLIGRHSDLRRERRWHYAGCIGLGMLGVGLAAVVPGPPLLKISVMAISYVGMASATPLFFTSVTEYLPRSVAAVGIALISSLGNLGPALSPVVTAYLNTRSGGMAQSLYFVALCWMVSGLLLLWTLRPRRP
ncbi:MAG: MFS transporter [Curvibacter sp.]|nr:MFS transporter [Curvibacter sp.]